VKKVFITFAGGQKYSTEYLVADARAVGVFDEVKGYGPKDLGEAFWRRHEKFFAANRRRRGYGRWIWKPYIIRREMESMSDDDILVYCDAGALVHERQRAAARLQESFQHLMTLPVGLCANRAPRRFAYGWSREYVLVAMDATSDSIRGMAPYRSGRILCRKHAPAMRVINAWADLVDQQRYDVFGPARSQLPDHPKYKKHFKEQVSLTILMGKYGGSNWDGHEKIFHRCRNLQQIMQRWLAQPDAQHPALATNLVRALGKDTCRRLAERS